MSTKRNYWIGEKPSGGVKWQYTDHATVLADQADVEAIFRMYRRYVKQWNDIELDRNQSLSKHTHQVCGASVVGAHRQFILHSHDHNQDHWILEIKFARGFKEFYPGWSFGRNAMRSTKDIRTLHLHWSHDGDKVFKKWLTEEARINRENGEWNEYKQ